MNSTSQAYIALLLIRRVLFRREFWSLPFRLVQSSIFFDRFFTRKIDKPPAVNQISGCRTLVSVVVPVNNGLSRGIERLIVSLKKQRDVALELIAVDSGSTDGTQDYLLSEGFRVIQLNPMEFSHDKSRNLGCLHAKGDFILFTVDDAEFEAENWLYTALSYLIYYNADSYTTRQLARSEHGLYSRWLEHLLAVAQSRHRGAVITRSNKITTFLFNSLRQRAFFRAGPIDNTNHLVRRDVIRALGFSVPSVEDIEFAIRLLRRGGRVIYSNESYIRHSHEYRLTNLSRYAKRVYLDTLVMYPWNPLRLPVWSHAEFWGSVRQVSSLFLQALTHALGVRCDKTTGLPLSGNHSPCTLPVSAALLMIDRYLGDKLGGREFVEPIVKTEFLSSLYPVKGLGVGHESRFGREFFTQVLRLELRRAASFFGQDEATSTVDEIAEFLVFLLTNKISAFAARGDLFDLATNDKPLRLWESSQWE